ncbi:uncharacterized protein PGTG_01458 [Puccinia graminis f. sp. tritici CRL 75-36-700-3]|uniref:Uncharacterized protein n=1 Tax=Puccinia graminis f. sp. tritici (strain CRL 75-36-700-3 / race SCCL) TaxID=418459 RepID=E3JSE0_PUCGT|nr:uncharacterized protein PGTG_01458 [Puccinia graminis f. sp. tritici CRL 75-36-700-3]EFP74865.2 hypothetical protein PGTG_01458 [Puccinia graminis f. sp. tritici CRL 75-36-700-3]
MHWNIHIRQLVDILLDQFGFKAHPLGEPLPEPTDNHKKPFAPRTPLQSQIHHAALHVNQTINQHTQELQTNPNAPQTFCLRYPTYEKFVEYSISMEKKCKLLPKDKMVVLLEEAGRCVGVAVPPDHTKEDGIFLSPPDRALAGLNDAIKNCNWNEAKDEIVYSTVPPPGPLQTPKPLDMDNKGEIRDPKPKTTEEEEPPSNAFQPPAQQSQTPHHPPNPKPQAALPLYASKTPAPKRKSHPDPPNPKPRAGKAKKKCKTSKYLEDNNNTNTDPNPLPPPEPQLNTKGKNTISYQPYGYGLGEKNSTGMQDLKIQVKVTPSARPQIDESSLQGRGIGWRDKPKVEPNLPDPQKTGTNRSNCLEMVNMRNELKYQFALSLWINKAFLPQSVDVAEKAVEYLLANGSGWLRETLLCESNKILACVACHGLHGYSFHGPGLPRHLQSKKPEMQLSEAVWLVSCKASCICQRATWHLQISYS